MARAARETDGEAEGVEIWTVDGGVLAVEGGYYSYGDSMELNINTCIL